MIYIEPRVKIPYSIWNLGGGVNFSGVPKIICHWYSQNRDLQHTLKKKITELKLGVYHHASPFKEGHLKKKCKK